MEGKNQSLEVVPWYSQFLDTSTVIAGTVLSYWTHLPDQYIQDIVNQRVGSRGYVYKQSCSFMLRYEILGKMRESNIMIPFIF